MPRVSIAVINWNGKDHVERCLEAISALDYPRDRLSMLVIDNASTDGSREAVSRSFPEFELLANETNLGCAAAENQGIRHALDRGDDYVWLLNNDVFVDPGALRELVHVAERAPEIAVVGPAVYATARPDVEDNLGYRINLWTGRFRSVVSSEPDSGVDAIGAADMDSVQGCASLIRTAVFETVDPYHERFEAYFEESDFHERVRRAGFRVVGVPAARVWHKQAASYNRVMLHRARLLLRNLVRFEWRNAETKHLIVFFPWFLLVHLPWFLVRGSFYALSQASNKSTPARAATAGGEGSTPDSDDF